MFCIQKKQGFTLIELLTVIAIIGLLSSVAFVTLFPTKKDALDARGVATAKSVAIAFRIAQDNNNNFPPYNYLTTLATSSAAATPGISIANQSATSTGFCVSYTLVNPELGTEIYKETERGGLLVPTAAGECS